MTASNCQQDKKYKTCNATLKLIIKGFIMSDNNHLDHEWRVLIYAGAGAHKIAMEFHGFRHGWKYLEPPICWWNVKQHKGFSSSWHINYSEQLWHLVLLLTALSKYYILQMHRLVSIMALTSCWLMREGWRFANETCINR